MEINKFNNYRLCFTYLSCTMVRRLYNLLFITKYLLTNFEFKFSIRSTRPVCLTSISEENLNQLLNYTIPSFHSITNIQQILELQKTEIYLHGAKTLRYATLK